MKLVRIFFIGLSMAIFCKFLPLASTKKLTTLDDFVQYSGELPELTSWVGSWDNPDFERLFFSQRPGLGDLLLDAIGVRKLSWQIGDLRDLLVRSVKQKRELVIKRTVKKDQRYVFLGDLRGAFHSFIRDLQELKREGLINNNLQIADDCTIVLLGNVINRSPYSLQLLTLVLLLLEKNPDRLLYLSGEDERSGYWKSFLSMRQPLLIYSKPWWESSKKKDESSELPLVQELTSFFGLLPESLILYAPNSSDEYIYCSQDSPSKDVLSDPKTRVLISGERLQSVAKKHSGLEFAGYDYGASHWALMSSPVRVYQDRFGFYDDSFVILTMGSSLRDTFLTHHYRDIRGVAKFTTVFADLLPGIKCLTLQDVRQVQKKPIYRFGSSTALFGGYGASGVPIKWGIEVATIQINQQGGVNGYLLDPVVLDDEYEGRLASINARKLTDEYGIDVFVSPQGTPTLNGYLDRVKNGEIAVLFPRSGANQFYDKKLKYLVNDLASVGDEVYALMDQMVNEFMIRTFAFVYPEDSFGLPFMETVRTELKKYGITKSFDVTYQHGQTDFTDQIKKMRESTDEGAGIFITGNAPVREFLSGLGMEFFLSKVAFATSFLDSVPFNQFINERGIRFTMSYPIPDPRAGSLPIFDNFNKAIAPYAVTYNASLFEGYLAVRLFADALAHIEPPFTKEKILGYFEGLKDYNFEGIVLTFNPEKRDIGMPVFIMTSEDRWVKYQNRHKVAEGEFIAPDNNEGGL